MLSFLWRIFSPSNPAEAQAAIGKPSIISVEYDEHGLRLSLDGQEKQAVAWDEIDLIAIRIEDEFLPFPYWYVGNKENLARIPNDAVGGKELFFDGFSEHLKGYKSDSTFRVIIEASGAIEGSFVVWRSEDAAAA